MAQGTVRWLKPGKVPGVIAPDNRILGHKATIPPILKRVRELAGECLVRGPGAALTRMHGLVLAGLIAAVTAAAAGCGGPVATPHTPASLATTAAPSAGTAKGAPAGPPPAGYRWAGSAAQGVWFAVPTSWAAINLAKVSATKAISRFAPSGMSISYLKTVLTEMSRRHAFYVADLASAVRSPHHFATNGNAFCVPTPLVPGAGSALALKAAIRPGTRRPMRTSWLSPMPPSTGTPGSEVNLRSRRGQA